MIQKRRMTHPRSHKGYLKHRSSRLKPIIFFLEKAEDEKPYFCSLYLPFLISVGLGATYHWE